MLFQCLSDQVFKWWYLLWTAPNTVHSSSPFQAYLTWTQRTQISKRITDFSKPCLIMSEVLKIAVEMFCLVQYFCKHVQACASMCKMFLQAATGPIQTFVVHPRRRLLNPFTQGFQRFSKLFTPSSSSSSHECAVSSRVWNCMRSGTVSPLHTSYLSFFLHGQNFWRIKFTPKFTQ